jgi:hypothetical protein
LSRAEVLALLSETRDPNLVQGFLHLCYAGIQSLEFDDLQVGKRAIECGATL